MDRARDRCSSVFRDHEKWGRSGYLVLQAGDFACRPRCTVTVTVDDRQPERLHAWRPDTDEAIAMFVDDAAKLWRLTGDAARLRIEFPVRPGGTRTASFEVGGDWTRRRCRVGEARPDSVFVGAGVLPHQVLVHVADDVLETLDAVPGLAGAGELVVLVGEPHHHRRPLQVLQRPEQLFAAG